MSRFGATDLFNLTRELTGSADGSVAMLRQALSLAEAIASEEARIAAARAEELEAIRNYPRHLKAVRSFMGGATDPVHFTEFNAAPAVDRMLRMEALDINSMDTEPELTADCIYGMALTMDVVDPTLKDSKVTIDPAEYRAYVTAFLSGSQA